MRGTGKRYERTGGTERYWARGSLSKTSVPVPGRDFDPTALQQGIPWFELVIQVLAGSGKLGDGRVIWVGVIGGWAEWASGNR